MTEYRMAFTILANVVNGFLQAHLHDLCQFLTLSCILLGDPFWQLMFLLHVEIILFPLMLALLVLDQDECEKTDQQ